MWKETGVVLGACTMSEIATVNHRADVSIGEHIFLRESIKRVCETCVDGCFCEIGVKFSHGTRFIFETLIGLGQISRQLYSIDHILSKRPFRYWRNVVSACSWQNAKFFSSDHTRSVYESIPNDLCWVFIDGCHCYECVYRDIECVAGKVARHGEICFHDTGTRMPKRFNLCFDAMTKAGEDKVVRSSVFNRRYGVRGAIQSSQIIRRSFEVMEDIDIDLSSGQRFGGLQVWRRK